MKATLAAILLGLVAVVHARAVPPVAPPNTPGPVTQLNPRRAHVELRLDGPPHLVFRATDGSAGSVLLLSSQGVSLDGRLLCSWPGGVYDIENSANMVLGYRRDPSAGLAEYEGCPAGLPIKSTWGDGGHGAAVLYLEIVSRSGTSVGMLFGRQMFYGDLNQLSSSVHVPSPPHTEGGAASTWVMHPTAEFDARQSRAAFQELRRNVSLQPYLRAAGACVRSTAPGDCLPEFVRDGIYLPETDIGTGVLSRSQFAAAVVTASDGDGRVLIDHLRACLSAGTPRALSGRAVDLVTAEAWICRLEEAQGAWSLADFFQADYVD